MVNWLQNPLGIIILALGVAFLLTLFDKLGRSVTLAIFYATLLGILALTGVQFFEQWSGAYPFHVYTAGFMPPLSINLHFGDSEGLVCFFVNLAGLFGGIYLFDKFKESVASMIIFLIVMAGINGVIMTRDLFNLFIFIEITAIGIYSLIALEKNRDSLAAGFKYIMAGALASVFFLLGTILLYHLTGTLNIDQMIVLNFKITGPVGFAALVMLLLAVTIELKPFPANGWGVDVYQASTPGVASIISVCVSAGAFFALYKLLPLVNEEKLVVFTWIGGITFIFSNLIGLKQTNPRRMLGYSSIGQMGLLVLALAVVRTLDLSDSMALILGGIFINHFLAKAGLFWLAGVVNKGHLKEWSVLAGRTSLIIFMGIFIFALIGMPPFPGFWAKWELVINLAKADMYGWVALILLGSLFEAVYLLRWFGYAIKPGEQTLEKTALTISRYVPMLTFATFLVGVGWYMGKGNNHPGFDFFLPVYIAAIFLLFNWLPTKIKGILSIVAVGIFTWWIYPQLSGIPLVFLALFMLGSMILLIATLYRSERQIGFYSLLSALIFSLGMMLKSQTSLEFFFMWEIMTLTSYLLILRGKNSVFAGLNYIIFSLASAFLMLAAFATVYAQTSSISLMAIGYLDSTMSTIVFVLFALSLLIKAGGLGLHIWVPGAYSESEDDFSAIISAVVSKAPIFGLLLVGIYLGKEVSQTYGLAYFVSWLGLITAFIGALMSLFQEDMKKLLAYSSIGQVGYIVSAVAIMSHLGWVSALYLSINHFLYKGLIFLAVAGVIHRTGTRYMYQTGGLIKKMPISFISVMIGIIAMSGVPPLTGFGGKWLIYVSLIEKGWYFQASLAIFASAVAFLYMFRLIHSIFLGIRKDKHMNVKEAPLWLIIPQCIIMMIIMAFSMMPKFLIEWLSAAVEPFYKTTIAWSGNLAYGPYGAYWNAFMIMNIVGVVFMVLLIWLLLARQRVQKVEQFNIVYAAERPDRPETTHVAYNFFSFYQRALGWLVRPRAQSFWETITEMAHTTAGAVRKSVYTGNAQTYALFILIFLIIFYFAMGA